MASPLAILARVSLLLLLFQSSSAQLTTTVYQTSCPGVYKVVKDGIRYAISAENRIGASLVRLFFHDCFVNGCDGSVLLDDTPNFLGEKTSPPNNNSMRGFEVIDKIKANVEKLCPGVVSCADILAIAARDSVVILGGPNWEVKVGRRDARSASFNDSTDALPPAIFNLSQLISSFQDQGLSVRDMVALSGAHTIGKARCTSFRDHVYNGSNIDQTFAKTRQANCPRITPRGDNNLAPLDRRTTRIFDNSYFKNLVEKKGLLPSDQELFNGASTDSIVLSYSRDTQVFFADFVAAMIKMGDRSPRPGTQLEIRRNCRRLN